MINDEGGHIAFKKWLSHPSWDCDYFNKRILPIFLQDWTPVSTAAATTVNSSTVHHQLPSSTNGHPPPSNNLRPPSFPALTSTSHANATTNEAMDMAQPYLQQVGTPATINFVINNHHKTEYMGPVLHDNSRYNAQALLDTGNGQDSELVGIGRKILENKDKNSV
ncbi:hypothetical protein G9A89_000561, partial [Geosiphon pyriformis]